MSRHHDSAKSDRNAREAKPNAAAEIASLQGDAISRTTSAMVRAGGQLQESVVRHTGLLQKEAAHQLRMATNPAELMTVQAALLMAGWQHSIQCTSDIANAWFAVSAAGATPKDRKLN